MMKKNILIILVILLVSFDAVAEENDYYNIPISYYYGRIINGTGFDLAFRTDQYISFGGDKIASLYSDANILFGKKDIYQMIFSGRYKLVVESDEEFSWDSYLYLPYGNCKFSLNSGKNYKLDIYYEDLIPDGFRDINFRSRFPVRLVYSPAKDRMKISKNTLNFTYHFGPLMNRNQFEIYPMTPFIRYGLTDRLEVVGKLDVNVNSGNMTLGLTNQINDRNRLYGTLNLDWNKWNRRGDSEIEPEIVLGNQYLSKRDMSIEEYLSDEDGYYQQMLKKGQLKWDQKIRLYRSNNKNYLSVNEALSYGITDYIKFLISGDSQYLTILNYKSIGDRTISDFDYYYGTLLNKGKFSLIIRCSEKINSETIRFCPRINFKYGISDYSEIGLGSVIYYSYFSDGGSYTTYYSINPCYTLQIKEKIRLKIDYNFVAERNKLTGSFQNIPEGSVSLQAVF